MYSRETVVKYVNGINERVKHYRKCLVYGEQLKVAISYGNKKIGRVMNVSTPAYFTCGAACKVCKDLCYDIKAAIQYGNVRNARARNLAILENSRKDYFDQIDRAISRRKKNKYFRWHVAGDIIDVNYFSHMVEIARNHPDFIFWTYTKQYDIVNYYVANNGGDRNVAIPANLSIMFSEWQGLEMKNPYNFPVFGVIFDNDSETVKAEKLSNHICPGNCDICKETNNGCIAGVNTYVWQH